MKVLFKIKRYSQLEILAVVFFSVEYLREVFLLVNPFLINSISLLIASTIICCLRPKINKRVRILLASMIGFIFIALVKGLAIGFLDPKTLVYSIFKSIEYLALVILLSNISLKVFLNILTLLIKVFIGINLVLLVYYFGALIGFLPSINRLVIFDYRFAGLSGEPAQFAQHCVFILFSILIVMKYNLLQKPKMSFSIVLFMLTLSFSNSIVLLAVFLLFFNFFFVGTGNVIKKFVVVVAFIPIGYLVATKIFTRLDLDFDAITNIVLKFKTLTTYAVNSAELTGGNPVTIRIFEFFYSLSLLNQPVANGFGSTLSYARFAGYVGENDFINMYGITQVGFELGLIPMFLFVMFLLWNLFVKSVVLSNDIRLLVASIFFMVFVMNGVGFKIVWFFLFLVLIHREWFLKKGIDKS